MVLEKLLAQEDSDNNKLITIDDHGPKVIQIQPARSPPV